MALKSVFNKACFIIFLFLVVAFQSSLNSLNSVNAQSSIEPLQISIIGEVGKVYEPIILCNDQNRIYISWKESEYFLNKTVGVYDYNDTVYIQEIFLNGSLKGDAVVVFDYTDIPFDIHDTADVNIVIDNDNNFNIFWYVLETIGNNVSSSDQFSHLFFKKLDPNLAIIEDVKIIYSYNREGISSSVFSDYCIVGSVADNYNRFHLLFDKQFYLYIDNNGNLLDCFNMTTLNLGDEYSGNTFSLASDKMNTTFVVSNVYQDYIYFTSFQIIGNNITNNSTQVIIFDEENILGDPEILFSNGIIYVSYYFSDHYTNQILYKELDYNGSVIQDVDLAIRKGTLSSNHSYVYSFYTEGVYYNLEDIKLIYSIYSFYNNLILEGREVVRFLANYSYIYSPVISDLNCIEDLTGNLWMTWAANDGANGFQLMYWKINTYGEHLIPIIKIAPGYYEYVIIVIPEFFMWNLSILVFISASLITLEWIRRKVGKK